MSKFLLFFSMLILMSCNNSCNETKVESVTTKSGEVLTKEDWRYDHETFVPPAVTEVVGKGIDMDALEQRKGRLLENACTLISQEVIASALGKTVPDITLRNASPANVQATQRSCFIKWSDFEVPNAGLFLQMITNPYEDPEYAEYITINIESYRTQGEGEPGSDPIIYKKLEGFGDDGSYSTEGGKYLWRLGNKISFLIAFNTAHGPEDQYKIATTLARAMTENYIK